MEEIINSINILISKMEKLNTTQPLECYTVKEVAQILKASENSIYNMIQSGNLKTFAVGEKESKKPVYRISRETLESFMHSSAMNEEKHNYAR